MTMTGVVEYEYSYRFDMGPDTLSGADEFLHNLVEPGNTRFPLKSPALRSSCQRRLTRKSSTSPPERREAAPMTKRPYLYGGGEYHSR